MKLNIQNAQRCEQNNDDFCAAEYYGKAAVMARDKGDFLNAINYFIHAAHLKIKLAKNRDGMALFYASASWYHTQAAEVHMELGISITGRDDNNAMLCGKAYKGYMSAIETVQEYKQYNARLYHRNLSASYQVRANEIKEKHLGQKESSDERSNNTQFIRDKNGFFVHPDYDNEDNGSDAASNLNVNSK